ncbi:MAG: HAD family hydrolase [Lachnospiraceae bacterium]|nr:HAD family hydrolase [Lachnospiraceae bacterium]
MDGVIYHGEQLIDGVKEFIDWLKRENKKFMFLTNSNTLTPSELSQKLGRLGLDVGEEHFYTSGLATARFISRQMPNATAYVIGEHGLYNALYDAGIKINDADPDYVIVGESRDYTYNQICRASDLVMKGARLIATAPDITNPVEGGVVPDCGAFVLPIEAVSGKKAYYIGKPNALMMRTGLKMLDEHSSDCAMIGDRMDTDVVVGMESGLDTVLVLSGVSTRETVKEFAYRPTIILNTVGDIVP